MKSINLTPLKNELEDESLQEYDLGEIVEVPDGAGIIAGMAEENIDFPTGATDRVERIEEEEEITDGMMKEIEASEDEPVYIVALQRGGSVAVTADEISSGTLEGESGESIETFEDITSEDETGELAPVYAYCDRPDNPAAFEQAKVQYIVSENRAALETYAGKTGTSVEELDSLSCEELVNILGVDDPHVGFDELPPGWNRKSVLQAWASVGGMWRTCYARMIRVRGPNFAKRWCAALKDEVLRTEEWRGDF